jgi:hypothetical protein
MESHITLSVFEGILGTKLINVELVVFCERCPSSKVIGGGSDHE